MIARRHWLATLALLLVLAAACIPYGAEDPSHRGLNVWSKVVVVLAWLVTAAVLAGLFVPRLRWLYDEAVFASISLYVAAAVIVATSTRLPTETRAALACTFAGVAVGIAAYWLAIRIEERTA